VHIKKPKIVSLKVKKNASIDFLRLIPNGFIIQDDSRIISTTFNFQFIICTIPDTESWPQLTFN
jgi:hypothetical protein